MKLPLENLLLLGSLAGYAAGVVLALLCVRRERLAALVGFGAPALAALAGLVAALRLLLGGVGAPLPRFEFIPPLFPFLTLTVRVDALGAFFLVVSSLAGLAISIYSIGAAKGLAGRGNVGVLAALFNALLLATALVFMAGDLWLFLGAWELMALTAYGLVSFAHEQPETRRAGVLYFIMSHLDAACVVLGLLLLFQASGSTSFDSLHAIGGHMAPGKRDAAFVLFLLGFGIKAGIVPLHIWLPAAHPVAPSNVSAFMSGVLIKSGIYGLIRVSFDFLGTPPGWWGMTVLVIGTVSAVLGVLYALMEHDLKRLLAYHSIENIGIILMGVGTSLLFLHSGHTALATLALIAGLYHTINHATFKGLLFLGAGAVLHATHTHNMEEMGGLAKRMPQTAFCFLIGAVAISALPPLNGFVSEWLTYQSLLQGFDASQSLERLVLPLSGAMLALTGALAAACFVKAYGVTFLAQPRSEAAAHAQEAGPMLRFGMAVLVVACVLLGLFPTTVIRLLDPVTQLLTGQQLSGQLSLANGLVLTSLTEKTGTISTLGLVLLAIGLLPIPFVLRWVLARNTRTRRAPTWDCGLRGLTPQMEYTATGFSKPIRMIFKALFLPRRDVQREYDFSPHFATKLQFESHVEEVFESHFYRPVRLQILRASRRIRTLQAGSIHAYLLYMFVTLVALLLFAR
ncbi:hydrogenase 4 subunit B [Opitutus terrae]|uniref:NADH dehydrogenase (Quinone) n=1 Tax=Opitutus terrae (strain DSM 11246 / JCM 15787 / PB90-1) TaxID=452637 RepID=B1ZSE3_OPITP|nr:hydrogenase 4 subunit B [Opitutus terrae]ACB75742.1 NADH dehydrogenase (quinone) [Opitutus terrae PB90-1]